MVDNICPHCRASNPAESIYCGNCGASLDVGQIILRRENGLTFAGRQLPSRQLAAIGISLAVSVAALLAEAGLILLRRRVQRMRASSMTPVSRSITPLEQEILPPKTESEVVTVYGERVVEIHRWGRPVRRIVERVAWRREKR